MPSLSKDSLLARWMDPDRQSRPSDYEVDDTQTVGALHDVPVNDTRKHALSPDCWCEPIVDEEADELLYVHFAHDGRDKDYH